MVFAAIAVFFLTELPNRLERRRLLPQLHRLRSLAHIVDMHQLTKAPERLRPDSESVNGPADDNLSRDAMERYLDDSVRGGEPGLGRSRHRQHDRNPDHRDEPEDLAEDLLTAR